MAMNAKPPPPPTSPPPPPLPDRVMAPARANNQIVPEHLLQNLVPEASGAVAPPAFPFAGEQDQNQKDEGGEEGEEENKADQTTPSSIKLPALHRGNKHKAGNASWLVTFGDLTALMLTFFVMLFSMSRMADKEWVELVDVLNKSFSPKQKEIPVTASTLGIESFGVAFGANLDYLRNFLSQSFQKSEALKNTQLTLINEQLILSFPDQLIFAKGGTNLQNEFEDIKTLNELALVFNQINNQIEIHGHAGDLIPISAGQDQGITQLSLSLDRARYVGAQLMINGYDSPPTIFALGARANEELSKDIPEKLRSRLLRRVDIVIRQEAKGQ